MLVVFRAVSTAKRISNHWGIRTCPLSSPYSGSCCIIFIEKGGYHVIAVHFSFHCHLHMFQSWTLYHRISFDSPYSSCIILLRKNTISNLNLINENAWQMFTVWDDIINDVIRRAISRIISRFQFSHQTVFLRNATVFLPSVWERQIHMFFKRKRWAHNSFLILYGYRYPSFRKMSLANLDSKN